MFQTTELSQDIVLENQNALVFAPPFDFKGDVLSKIFVEGLVDKAVGALAKLLDHLESIRNAQILFQFGLGELAHSGWSCKWRHTKIHEILPLSRISLVVGLQGHHLIHGHLVGINLHRHVRHLLVHLGRVLLKHHMVIHELLLICVVQHLLRPEDKVTITSLTNVEFVLVLLHNKRSLSHLLMDHKIFLRVFDRFRRRHEHLLTEILGLLPLRWMLEWHISVIFIPGAPWLLRHPQ